MRKKIFFATRNENKVNDLKIIFNDIFDIESINDLGIDLETVEDADTFEGNSLKKAQELFEIVKQPVISDDSGLIIKNLDGFPGVNSNRWFEGKANNWREVNLLLLDKMKEKNLINSEERKASFKTVVTYIDENNCKQFEGVINGVLANDLKGENGFGYSPIFIKDGDVLTQAEVSDEERTNNSHRSIAFQKFLKWYKEENNND